MQISYRFLADTEEYAGVLNPSYLFDKREHRIVTFTNGHDKFKHYPGKYTYKFCVSSCQLVAGFLRLKLAN